MEDYSDSDNGSDDDLEEDGIDDEDEDGNIKEKDAKELNAEQRWIDVFHGTYNIAMSAILFHVSNKYGELRWNCGRCRACSISHFSRLVTPTVAFAVPRQ